MPDSHELFDGDEVLRHLKLLNHGPSCVTQIQVERRFHDDDEERRARANRSPIRWMGFYRPARYDELVEQLAEFYRRRGNVAIIAYVGANARTEAALPYADHILRPAGDIWRDGHAPRFVDNTFCVRSNYLLDLDFKGGRRRDVTTAAEKARSRRVAERLRRDEPGLRDSSQFDSGNNAYLVAHLPDGDWSDEVIRAYHYRLIAKYGLDPRAPGGVRLDSSWDRYKIMGLAGTQKRKAGDPRLWRMQGVLHEGRKSEALAAELRTIAAELAEIGTRKQPTRARRVFMHVAPSAQSVAHVEERIASWCGGYGAIWETPEVDDRSRALFCLCLKMVADGWDQGETLVALREWCSRRSHDRNDTWFDRLLANVAESLERGTIPAHRTVEQVLGSCPCPGGCDVEQAAAGRRRDRALLEVPWDARKYPAIDEPAAVGLPLPDARVDLAHFVGVALMDARRSPRFAILFAGPPGMGKTRTARLQTRGIRTLWVMNRLAEFPKLEIPVKQRRPTDIPLRHIHRRSNICEIAAHRAEIQRLEQQGLGRFASRVCEACELNHRCAYFTQFVAAGPTSFVATSAWLGTPQFTEMARHVDLIVFDEDPLHAAFADYCLTRWTLATLEDVIVRMGVPRLRCIVKVVDRLLSASDNEWHALVRGQQTVRDWLTANAGQLEDLRQIADWRELERREREVTACLRPEACPPVSVVKLARTVRRVVAGRRPWCPLHVMENTVDGFRVRALNLVEYKRVTVEKPVLILDSTGDVTLYQHLFDRHHVTVDPASCKVQAHVVQVYDQALPLRSLRDTNKREQVEAVVSAIARQRIAELGPGVLVVGRREVLDRLRLPPGTERIHYGGQRGSRAFERCHTAVVVGSAEPPPEELATQAEAMLKRPISRERTRQRRPYLLERRPGMAYGTEVKCYANPIQQALLERVREGEMIQAAYRIRPLTPGHPRKHVYLLSNLPLELLPPNELATLDELATKFGQGHRLIDRIRATWDDLRRDGRKPTQAAVAERLGISKQAVSRALKNG